MKTIYVDLDGVLADMESYLWSRYGYNWRKEIEKPNWGSIAVLDQRIYRDLPIMQGALDLMTYLNETYYDVEVLTAIPKRALFPEAVNDKRDWVYKHIDPNMKVNFGPYAQDKQYWCKPSDILIDDMEINIEQWRNKGGIGILHLSTEQTIKELNLLLTK